MDVDDFVASEKMLLDGFKKYWYDIQFQNEKPYTHEEWISLYEDWVSDTL